MLLKMDDLSDSEGSIFDISHLEQLLEDIEISVKNFHTSFVS